MQFNMEKVIFSHLLSNPEYARQIVPFLKKEYFSNQVYKEIFQVIDDYVKKHKSFPTKEAIKIDLDNRDDLMPDVFDSAIEFVEKLERDENTDLDWLIDNTEKYCKEQALHNALAQAIEYREDKSRKEWNKIPTLLQDALAVSFKRELGHDYLEDWEKRFEYYHQPQVKIPTGIEYLDKITRGGFKTRTINIFAAGVNVGKTLIMCSISANALMRGLNVLYLTGEVEAFEIGKRIDANLLDTSIYNIEGIPKPKFGKRVEKLSSMTKGRLVIEEFPTSAGNVSNFRAVINELKLKKNFIPHIILVDYLNICSSVRFKNMDNLYAYGKAVAEELRGLGAEFNVPVVTGIQFNRKGFSSSNPGMEDIADSFAIAAAADLMIAVTQNETFEALGQYLMKQIKNRYAQKKIMRKYLVGVDIEKMKLYDLEPEAQEDILDDSGIPDEAVDKVDDGPMMEEDIPVMDTTKFGSEDKRRTKFNDFK